ncbi:DUF5312 family protein [Spirochaeta dissipatitropha]
MAESIFDTLVQGMSREERVELLGKIQRAPGLDPDPLVVDLEDPAEIDMQAEYNSLSLWRKIIIFFQKSFTGKSRNSLVEELLLKKIGRKIVTNHPGFINAEGPFILEGFARRVEDLRSSILPLANPLSIILGDNRKQFVAFMFSMIAPDTYDLIRQETDPKSISSAYPELSERELKTKMIRSFKDILESARSDQRKQVYMNYRFLGHLLQLSSFPYMQIIQEFSAAGNSYRPAKYTGLDGVLRRLDSQIHSITEIPSSDILQQVFVFLEKELGDETEQTEKLTKQLETAAAAISSLRSFIREVPLRDIIAFCSGDIRYAPIELSGGEDWFTLFRDHISDIIDRRVDAFIFDQRKKHILSSLLKLGNTAQFPDVSPYGTEKFYNSGKFPFSLAVSQFILDKLFTQRWMSPLKILLIDGEFYKDANRDEYDAAYQTIEGLSSRIEALLSDLPKEVKKPPSEMKGFLSNVDKRAISCVDDLLNSLQMLFNVLNGLLFGEVGGRFDTIANLGQINGRANKLYLQQLNTMLKEIITTKEFLAEAIDLEQTKRRL